MVAPRQITAADVAALGVAGLYNFDPAQLPRWRAALAKMRRGSANARLALVGDSTTRGSRTGGGAAQNQTGYPPQLVAMLNASGYANAGWGNLFSGGSTSDTVPATDSRGSLTGGMAVSLGPTTTSVGGQLYGATASGGLAFTPTASFDTVDVYYVQNSGFGTFTVNIDGGASLGTINSAGAAAFSKATFSTTLGAHTVNIAWASGQIYIVGADTYNSAAKQVSGWNLGWPGAKAADLADTSFAWKYRSALGTLAPDLTIIDVGINDWAAGTSLSAYSASVQSLITTAKASGDVILKTPVPSAIGIAPLATQSTYVAALRSLAASNNAPLIDVWTRFGSYETLNPLGLYSDVRHPTDVGYADVASAVFASLRLI